MPHSLQVWAPLAARHPRNGHVPEYLIIHSMEGTLAGTVSWFQTSPFVAHYLVGANGDVVQMVPDEYSCWHAGNNAYNERSLGIEHAGYADKGLFTDACYEASAKIAAVLCKKYNIPVDRAHILGHSEVPGATHHDPGPYWDWDKYMALVQAQL